MSKKGKEMDRRALLEKVQELEKFKREEESQRRKEETAHKKQVRIARSRLKKETERTKHEVKKLEGTASSTAKTASRISKSSETMNSKKISAIAKFDEAIQKATSKHNDIESNLRKQMEVAGEAKGKLAHLEFSQRMLESGFIVPASPSGPAREAIEEGGAGGPSRTGNKQQRDELASQELVQLRKDTERLQREHEQLLLELQESRVALSKARQQSEVGDSSTLVNDRNEVQSSPFPASQAAERQRSLSPSAASSGRVLSREVGPPLRQTSMPSWQGGQSNAPSQLWPSATLLPQGQTFGSVPGSPLSPQGFQPLLTSTPSFPPGAGTRYSSPALISPQMGGLAGYRVPTGPYGQPPLAGGLYQGPPSLMPMRLASAPGAARDGSPTRLISAPGARSGEISPARFAEAGVPMIGATMYGPPPVVSSTPVSVSPGVSQRSSLAPQQAPVIQQAPSNGAIWGVGPADTAPLMAGGSQVPSSVPSLSLKATPQAADQGSGRARSLSPATAGAGELAFQNAAHKLTANALRAYREAHADA